MSILITMPNGITFLIDVQLSKTTVYDVKKILMEKIGINVDEQILFFNEEVLHNDKMLNQYGIEIQDYLQSETTESLVKKYKEQIESQKEDLSNQKAQYSDLSQQFTDLQEKNKEILQEKQLVEAELQRFKDSQDQKNKNYELQIRQIKQQLQGKQDELKKMEAENIKMKGKLEQRDLEIQRLEGQISFYGKEKELQFSSKVENEQQKFREAKLEIKENLRKIEQINYLSEEKSNEIIDLKQKIEQLECLLEDSKKYNKQLEEDKIKYQKQTQSRDDLIKKIREYESQQSIDERRFRDLKSQIQNLQTKNDEMSKSRCNCNENEKKILEFQRKIAKLEAECKAFQMQYDESYQKLNEKKNILYEKQKNLDQSEESKNNLENQMKIKDIELKQKDKLISQLEEDLNDLIVNSSKYKERCDQAQQIANQTNTQNQIQIDVDVDAQNLEQKVLARREKRLEEQKKNQINKKLEDEKRRLIQIEEEHLFQQFIQKGKEKRLKTAQFLKTQMKETHGKIEVCFLIDVTGSMDPYKESAMKCISESMKSIKLQTNRDTLWATVAYQDFGEKKQLGGLYQQLNFTQNSQELIDFLAKIKCSGGGDAPEDIRGGIKQMVKNLIWTKTFKIAILICDSPNHGKKYNNGLEDRYPDEDLDDALELLIDNKILFVLISFNSVTLKMFQEIQNIYRANDKEELLLLADFQNIEKGKIWIELVELVSQASQRATQTNNRGTKSKNQAANKRSQEGAMEALCKTIKDPFQFDKLPGINCISTKFAVIRVEIKQISFESNIENIKKIDIIRDYNVFQEGQWQCKRTQKYFAQGQMKQVFLMRRDSNPNELYVIKIPLGDQQYQTQQAALLECRSHLIAKSLMKKFIKDLQEANDKSNKKIKIPEVQYSDFLILKDLSIGNSYWIAERYFSGEFVKYNNNNGFISDENSDINHFAQAFSYYSYFTSNFNYMVCDVQGVGNYFTDPALNTKEGNFDETDMGIDGQSMFMVQYEGKKHIGQKYLDLLGIHC